MVGNSASIRRQLSLYRKKRDFNVTREPSGSEKPSPKKRAPSDVASGLRYLIQKHAATRLHYDFRLEIDGVLKSWAVTRGPSLDPEDKRLAVRVEDHPMDYGHFEGTIPKGQYGGGTVMLWDEGTWTPIGDIHKAYTKGHIDFELRGERLKGRWHLVRMHRRPGEKRENWLLIKGNDEFAKPGDGDDAVVKYQKSVVTKRAMPAIAKGEKVWNGSGASEGGPKSTSKIAVPSKFSSKARETKLKKRDNAIHAAPQFIAPQLATLVDIPPDGANWVHEIKYDGYRILAQINGGKIRLTTRSNNDWTHKFKSLAADISEIAIENALFDGEIVSRDATGVMSFHGLQQALKTDDPSSLHYYIFDILFLDGEDLRSLPLIERKDRLQTALRKAPNNIHYSEHFHERGQTVLHHACSIALEGIVSKRSDAAYHSGRGHFWLKSKCHKEQEIVIGGYTEQPKHPGYLGAILTGYYEKGKLVYSGKCGTGFSHDEGRALLKKLKALVQKTSPFAATSSDAKKGAVWVEPRLVAQIQFMEWTPEGAMRHPSFLGLREDKPAEDVVKERAKPLKNVVTDIEAEVKATSETDRTALVKESSKIKDSETTRTTSGTKVLPNGSCVIGGVTITHPDRKLFPDSAITKRDLAEYYARIAPLMLPYVAKRPVSLVRCPHGEGKACFFQRHGSDTLSPYIKPVPFEGEKEPYLMIDDTRGLVSLVQMGVLEVHMWGSHANDPHHPDLIVFDLDPSPELNFSEVKRSATDIRERLAALNLKSFVKTTGGKGLHIVLPFHKGPSWDAVKEFTRLFGQHMVEENPSRFTINNRKDKRIGKIYIDYLRNGETASAVAPYSTRARKNAPVALPIDWEDLRKLKSAHDFSITDLTTFLKHDPWHEMRTLRQKLPL